MAETNQLMDEAATLVPPAPEGDVSADAPKVALVTGGGEEARLRVREGAGEGGLLGRRLLPHDAETEAGWRRRFSSRRKRGPRRGVPGRSRRRRCARSDYSKKSSLLPSSLLLSPQLLPPPRRPRPRRVAVDPEAVRRRDARPTGRRSSAPGPAPRSSSRRPPRPRSRARPGRSCSSRTSRRRRRGPRTSRTPPRRRRSTRSSATSPSHSARTCASTRSRPASSCRPTNMSPEAVADARREDAARAARRRRGSHVDGRRDPREPLDDGPGRRRRRRPVDPGRLRPESCVSARALELRRLRPQPRREVLRVGDALRPRGAGPPSSRSATRPSSPRSRPPSRRASSARASPGDEKLRHAVGADGFQEHRVVDDLLLRGSAGRTRHALREETRESDFFEWNPEGTQEQVLAAVGRDARAPTGDPRTRRGEKGAPDPLRRRPAASPRPSSPSRKSEIRILLSTNPKFVIPSRPTERGLTKSRMRAFEAESSASAMA